MNIKKLYCTTVLLFVISLSFAQKKSFSKCQEYYTCSQKNGLSKIDGNYTLAVQYDNNKLSFTTNSKGIPNTFFNIVKITDRYVIGKNDRDNYAFFDISKKYFFYIDHFMNRYLVGGYGSGGKDVKQYSLKIMDILKKGDSQKDAIQYLIKQTNYDF